MPPLARGYAPGSSITGERDWVLITIMAAFYGPVSALLGVAVAGFMSATGVTGVWVILGFIAGFMLGLWLLKWIGAFN